MWPNSMPQELRLLALTETSDQSSVEKWPLQPMAGGNKACLLLVMRAQTHASELVASMMQGLRLSELMPRSAAFGVGPMYGGGGGLMYGGGSGGPADPWKALSVKWDPGTLLGWPSRVSPWEVSSRAS